MKLQKIAHIKIPDHRPEWMKPHLANPIVRVLDSKQIRVYCNIRNQSNQTHITYMDIDFNDNFKITYFHDQPLLSLGPAGAFDDCGQSLGCVITKDNQDYLFYLGWNLANNVPFRNSIGLAISPNGINQYTKYSDGPIMDRNVVDPYSLSYPYILLHAGTYKMWYGSHTVSGSEVRNIRHCLKYAESKDLINWDRKNVICLDVTDEDIAFTRPFVIYENGIFKMWYSYLRSSYRIGYAESKNGKNWTRLDHQLDLDVSPNGWDADMIEYPYVFNFANERYIAYCGNQFGMTGFGIAKFIE